MSYTWATFLEHMRNHLPVESDRLGVGVAHPGRSRSFLEVQIRQAVIDIQRHVESYRVGHETVMRPEDFVEEGNASRGSLCGGSLPSEAELTDAYLVRIENSERSSRYPVTLLDWRHRNELVYGLQAVNDGKARMAIDREAHTFWIYPRVFDCWVLSLFWNGVKVDFEDDEETPFDEMMVGAVAEYVNAKIARDVDKDLQRYSAIMSPGAQDGYIAKRRALLLRHKDKIGANL